MPQSVQAGRARPAYTANGRGELKASGSDSEGPGSVDLRGRRYVEGDVEFVREPWPDILVLGLLGLQVLESDFQLADGRLAGFVVPGLAAPPDRGFGMLQMRRTNRPPPFLSMVSALKVRFPVSVGFVVMTSSVTGDAPIVKPAIGATSLPQRERVLFGEGSATPNWNVPRRSPDATVKL